VVTLARILACWIVILCLAGPASAQGEKEGWGYGLWNELMSPFCPGRTLADCPSGKAEELRIWIVEQEDGGRSRTEVMDELYAAFGDVLRQAPVAEGVGLAAYVIPVLLFLAGGALIGFFLRRQRGGVAPETEPPVRAVDPELERALDTALDEDPGAERW
jgi:cytochrome c-type biogenesis protein CcmH/NrfF